MKKIRDNDLFSIIRLGEKSLTGREVQAFVDKYPDCRCSEIPTLEKKVQELEAENDKLCTQLDSESQISYLRQDEIEVLRKALDLCKEYLEDMASFECFCCNLPKLSSELLGKIEALNGKESEVCIHCKEEARVGYKECKYCNKEVSK